MDIDQIMKQLENAQLNISGKTDRVQGVADVTASELKNQTSELAQVTAVEVMDTSARPFIERALLFNTISPDINVREDLIEPANKRLLTAIENDRSLKDAQSYASDSGAQEYIKLYYLLADKTLETLDKKSMDIAAGAKEENLEYAMQMEAVDLKNNRAALANMIESGKFSDKVNHIYLERHFQSQLKGSPTPLVENVHERDLSLG